MRILPIVLVVMLAASGCTPQRDAAEKEEPAGDPPAEPSTAFELKTLGWTPGGRFDADYARYSGSGLVSGTVVLAWEDGPLDPPPAEGGLHFTPDNQSRKKYPILDDVVDLSVSEQTLLALNLPRLAPRGEHDCGFEVTATLVLGDYFKFDAKESDAGRDTASLAAVVKSSSPRIVDCTPGSRKISNARI